jgi:hypothetical protein
MNYRVAELKKLLTAIAGRKLKPGYVVDPMDGTRVIKEQFEGQRAMRERVGGTPEYEALHPKSAAYCRGYMAKCAQLGIDPRAMAGDAAANYTVDKLVKVLRMLKQLGITPGRGPQGAALN